MRKRVNAGRVVFEIKLHRIFSGSLLAVLVLSGCATIELLGGFPQRHAALLNLYPPTSEPLGLRRISVAPPAKFPGKASGKEILIIVHPAYSLFFRDLGKSNYSDAKFALLKLQFEHETRMIKEAAAARKTVVLVIPGNYANDSLVPQSYVSYLNSLAPGGKVYYVLSETSSSGRLTVTDMENLSEFIEAVAVDTVMIGGGYIGRCQQEFHRQLAGFFESDRTYIVPEISTIAPEDVSDYEALALMAGLSGEDYSLIKLFIDKKYKGKANALINPPARNP